MKTPELSFDAENLCERFNFQGATLDTGIAYGSGVMGHGNGMLDFMLVTKNPVDWHMANKEQNGLSDYSCFVKWISIRDKHYKEKIKTSRILGERCPYPEQDRVREHFEKYQDSGAGIYYCHGEFEGRKMKFGVISKQRLLADLEGWYDFYVAGRMQKPQVIMKSSPEFDEAQKKNLISALRVALFYLPENFTWDQLLYTIASLSYKGETRPEDPKKVEKISKKDPEGYREWIHDAVQTLVAEGNLYITDVGGQQNRSSKSICTHLDQMPAALQGIDFKKLYFALLEKEDASNEDLINIQHYIEREIRGIVRAKSWEQTKKGIVSAGFSGVPYAGAKVIKGAKGKLKQVGNLLVPENFHPQKVV